MKIKVKKTLLKKGEEAASPEITTLIEEIEAGIRLVDWPLGTGRFVICPTKQANGVRPIKAACMAHLRAQGWDLERRQKIGNERVPGPIDAIKELSSGRLFAVEWETGNISSSHRALNKMALGMRNGVIAAAVLILPTRAFYKFLTDRVGNYEELAPYFSVWEHPDVNGLLLVIAIEHDGEDPNIPRIPKGTEGRSKRRRKKKRPRRKSP